jgi:hypothetical protein
MHCDQRELDKNAAKTVPEQYRRARAIASIGLSTLPSDFDESLLKTIAKVVDPCDGIAVL